MKKPVDSEKEIVNAVKKTTAAYLKFKSLSQEVEKLITPLLKNAKTEDDAEYLLNITSPVDKEGRSSSGDYIGRLWIYQRLEEILRKGKTTRKAKLL